MQLLRLFGVRCIGDGVDFEFKGQLYTGVVAGLQPSSSSNTSVINTYQQLKMHKTIPSDRKIPSFDNRNESVRGSIPQ